MSNTHWKLTFDVKRRIDDYDEGEENKEPVYQQAKVQVEILKVPN